MIPLRLELTNFLSYRQTAVLDFEGIHLGCISGLNGAGKSSILDAITWAIFGKSRSGSDDDVINRQAAHRNETAEVNFCFQLEGTVYRIVRRKQARKPLLLEFQVATGDGRWKALTESKLRETQAAVESLLNMTYDTFCNASFLLQGKADEFTTRSPNQRKEILAELLGLGQWERYKEAATARRREVEGQVTLLDGGLVEIEKELAEEAPRQAALEAARRELADVSDRRALQEKLRDQLRLVEAAVKQQKVTVSNLAESLARTGRLADGLRQTQSQRQKERDAHQALLAQAEAIRAAFAAHQEADEAARAWQSKADASHALQQQRRPHELTVERGRSRMAQEHGQLEKEAQRVEGLRRERPGVARHKEEADLAISSLVIEVATLGEQGQRHALLSGEIQSLKGDQERIKEEGEKIRERIDRLEAESGGQCPLCGQELTEQHRQEVLADLQADRHERLGRYRDLQARWQTAAAEAAGLAEKLKQSERLERERHSQQERQARAQARLEAIDRELAEWEANSAGRLAELQRRLAADEIAPEAQAALLSLDAETATLGYDEAAHDEARRALQELSDAPGRFHDLRQAEAAVRPLEDSLRDLAAQIAEQESTLVDLRGQHEQAAAQLEAMLSGDADLPAAEKALLDLIEQENNARRRLIIAEQNVYVLADQQRAKEKRKAERTGLTLRIQRLKLLERACGRQGVQALLIERALPEIEDHANELLERLTHGEMRVDFRTQRPLKSEDRLAETLDIRISDNLGERPYGNFSGGERFRIDFAIRIALSKVLARRAGARLQTLVIDEGFGSQDPDGRQRLVEALNVIKDDFARVLIITHIDELRDAFPVRIEVEKGPSGSRINVL